MKTLFGHLIILLSIGQVFGQKTEEIKLIEYSQSTCDKASDPYRLKPRIISLEHHNDTLTIEVGFAMTCCIEYIPNINYSNDTLYLSYGVKDEGQGCACICCYSFNHKLKGVTSAKLTVKLYNQVIELSNEKYWTYEPVFTIVEGDTLNLKDKYGMRQGIWTDLKAGFSKLKEERHKVDRFGTSKKKWKIGTEFSASYQRYKDDRLDKWGHLYKNLVIKDEYDPHTKITREYYDSGQIKRECLETDDKTLICRQWDKNGNETKED